jgi:hypothetical protein
MVFGGFEWQNFLDFLNYSRDIFEVHAETQ